MSVVDTGNMIVRDPLIQGFSYDELQLGAVAYYTKTVTESDVNAFAGVTGDFNPAHVNQSGAEAMKLPGRIAHGALTAGLISAALGTKMPGQGCLYVSQNSKFLKMVCLGDTLTVRLEIAERNEEKRRVKIKTDVYNQKDELVVTGMADILPRK